MSSRYSRMQLCNRISIGVANSPMLEKVFSIINLKSVSSDDPQILTITIEGWRVLCHVSEHFVLVYRFFFIMATSEYFLPREP